MNQVEADEILAKRLQEQFDAEELNHGMVAHQVPWSHSNQPTEVYLRSPSMSKEVQGNTCTSKAQTSNKPDVNHSANISNSDSDITYIEEEEEEEEEEVDEDRPGLPESSSAKRAASVKEMAPALVKRSMSSHDISDSDTDDDSNSEKPSHSLLRRMKGRCEDNEKDLKHVRRGASSLSSSSISSGMATASRTSAAPSRTYKIPRLKSSSSSSSNPSTTQTDNKKPKCQYGGKCYRKNTSHRREFRHSDDGEDEMPPSKKLKRDDASSTSSVSSPALSSRKNCLETIREASPLCFLLTKVTGIPEKYNNSLAVHISDILSPCMGDLTASAQFNYMFDIPWLVEQYPPQFRSKPLLIIHGEQRQSKIALHEAAHPYPNIKLCQAKLDIMYGTHHSKMMFLLYNNGMRVVIHTANIIDGDWYQKTQGVWVSPLFPKAESSTDTDSVTFFQRDLVGYLTAYRSPSLLEWIGHIKKHDMSQARVHIVGSVPGRHTGGSINKWGHLKLQQVLKDHGPSESDVKGWPVIGQFSSVGSLGPDKDKWLCGEWLQSMTQCRGVGRKMQGESGNKTLKLIFPSKDNVRTSLEGYPAGGSIPYSIKTAKKQLYFHSFLHQWISSTRGRSRASPHIKTYCRLSPNSQYIAWFLVTSANMSKAAWGALEKNAQQLMIRSYEIGVLFLPPHFASASTRFVVSDPRLSSVSDDELHFPLPWDVPLVPYSKHDRPWLWDIPYTDLPDSHGNCWVPPR